MHIDLSGAVAAFLVEGRELLNDLELGLLRLEQGHARDDRELVHALFRAAHTIKGSAGIVGIDSLGHFTHHVETLMDRVRAGERELDDAVLGVLLQACDHIGALLECAEQGDYEGRGLSAAGDQLVRQLGALSAQGEAPGAAPGAAHGGDARAPAAASAQAATGLRLWALFGKDCLRDGMDPACAVSYLAERVPVQHCRLDVARVPALQALQPEDCWLALALSSSAGNAALAREAFEFFAEGSHIVAVDGNASAAQVAQALQPLRAQLEGECPPAWRAAGLVRAGEWDIGEPAVTAVPDEADPAQALDAAAAPGSAAAGPAGTPATQSAQSATRVVRVPAQRLDELITQVGELVIASAGVDLLARQTRNVRLQEAVAALTQMVDTLQSSALQLRMVPIGETFVRFQRIVRDLSRELGKDIALELQGADTELDKSMVERIGDPLMHLVRNAIDHGLEAPAQRQARGKPAQGTLRLKAYHDSGNVVIEVSDDGRGLDRERILAKATERGLLAPGAVLSEHEIDQLIFEPGFSTAEQVTNLSGRGVGMDVVKKSIAALRGTITLSSRPGEGTLVQMRLPLTLAIIDGFMVGVGGLRFILPLDLVVECIELPVDALDGQAPRYLALRDEVLPYVCLRDFFGVPGDRARRGSVVVVRSGELKAGVLVDSLHGEIQTVIKPMSRIFKNLRALGGTSILGSGDIALIVDVHQLVQRSVDRSADRTPRHAAIA